MEDPEYPFRVLIDDENFIHGGSRSSSFAQRKSRSTFDNRQKGSKFGTQKYGKQNTTKLKRKKTVRKYTSIESDRSSSTVSSDCECSECCKLSDTGSESYSDSTVSIVSDQKRYVSHNSRSDGESNHSQQSWSSQENMSERSFKHGTEMNESSADYSDGSDYSAASSADSNFGTRSAYHKKRKGHIGHDMYHNAKPGVDEIHSIIFNTVSKELQQLKDKGFNYPAGYDPSKQTLENNEITLFALRLQEQRVNNRNRIKGFIRIASMLFSVICQWAKIEVLNTENFVSDISASIAAGEYDAFIDMIEPDLQNNILTHPFTSMFVKFVDTASESSENRKREKRAEQTTKEAQDRKMANDEKLQAIFAKMPRRNSD